MASINMEQINTSQKAKVRAEQLGRELYGDSLADHILDSMRYPIKHGFGLKWYQKLWRWLKHKFTKRSGLDL